MPLVSGTCCNLWPRAVRAETVLFEKPPDSSSSTSSSALKLGRSIASCGLRPQSSVPSSSLAVKWMMSAPPGLPPLSTSLPVALSNTSVGDMDERGRLDGSTRLATGLPSGPLGMKLKSVSWLLSKKPPASPTPRLTMMCAPQAASMLLVMATALP